MMDHPLDWLSAYVDDELQADQRRYVEEHLNHCESCAAVIQELKEMKEQVTRFYEAVQPPLRLEQQVMVAIRDQTRAESWVRSWLLVSATGLICLSVFWFLSGSIFLPLASVVFKFMLASVYFFSSLVHSVPSVFGFVLAFAVMLLMISGISLRRLLRSTTQ